VIDRVEESKGCRWSRRRGCVTSLTACRANLEVRPEPGQVAVGYRVCRRASLCETRCTGERPLPLSQRITLDDDIRVGTQRLEFPLKRPIGGLHGQALGNDVRQLAEVGRRLVEVR